MVPSHCREFAPFNHQKQRREQTNKGVQQQHTVGFFVRGNCRCKKIMYANLLCYYLSQNALKGGKLNKQNGLCWKHFAEVILLNTLKKSDYLNAPFVCLTLGQTNFFELIFFLWHRLKKIEAPIILKEMMWFYLARQLHRSELWNLANPSWHPPVDSIFNLS